MVLFNCIQSTLNSTLSSSSSVPFY
jgi:hypothetical protein